MSAAAQSDSVKPLTGKPQAAMTAQAVLNGRAPLIYITQKTCGDFTPRAGEWCECDKA